MTAKTLTIRLPASAYERATALAKRRKQSLNRVFQDSLTLLDQHDRESQLFDDFSLIAAAGSRETDMEFARDAQSEATGA